jgi:hypothetical protein
MGTAGLRAYSNRQSTISTIILPAVQEVERRPGSLIALAPCILHSEIRLSEFGIAVQVPKLGKLAVSADHEDHRVGTSEYRGSYTVSADSKTSLCNRIRDPRRGPPTRMQRVRDFSHVAKTLRPVNEPGRPDHPECSGSQFCFKQPNRPDRTGRNR